MGLSWLEQDGKRILVAKYGLDNRENVRLLEEQGAIERQHPDLLILSDFSGTTSSAEYMTALQAYGKEFRSVPTHVKNAVVGITGLKRALFRAYLAFTGDRQTKAFSSRAEALRWLIE